MTSTAVPNGRPTLLDRVVRWHLDLDGDLYGDERERLRWYEGMAAAASVQWLALPWAAVVLVWTLGRPAVLPLSVVLGVLYVPMALCTVYVRRRRVDTAVLHWSAKRITLMVLSALSYLLFVLGAFFAYREQDAGLLVGGAVGGVIGGGVSIAKLAHQSRRRRRQEAALLADEG